MGEMSGLGLEDWVTAITEQDGRIRLGGGDKMIAPAQGRHMGRQRVGGWGGGGARVTSTQQEDT